jgi:hypothetical protein
VAALSDSEEPDSGRWNRLKDVAEPAQAQELKGLRIFKQSVIVVRLKLNKSINKY